MTLHLEDFMYELSNGGYLRISSVVGDVGYNYDYFDASKKLVDGGVIEEDVDSEFEIITTALEWCGLDVKLIHWKRLPEGADTCYLEREGFTGW